MVSHECRVCGPSLATALLGDVLWGPSALEGVDGFLSQGPAS